MKSVKIREMMKKELEMFSLGDSFTELHCLVVMRLVLQLAHWKQAVRNPEESLPQVTMGNLDFPVESIIKVKYRDLM